MSSIPPPQWPKIWVAIFCRKRSASTLPCRKHLLQLSQLSTHSSMALPSSPDISRKQGCNQPSVCVLWLSKMLDTCFGFATSNAVLMSKGTLLVLPPYHAASRNSFLPKFFFKQVRNHHLQLLAAYPVVSPTCKLFSFSSSDFLLQAQEDTRCTPLGHHRCVALHVASDSFLRGQRQVSSKKKKVSRSSTSFEIPSDPEIAPENISQQCSSFHGQPLIISLTIASAGPFTLLSLSLALACNTKSIVICTAPVFCKLLLFSF